MAPTRQIAVFDFDGTLSKRDVLVEFLVRFAGPRTVLLAFLRHAGLALRVLVGSASRNDLKAAVLRDVLCGKRATDLDLAGVRFAHLVRARRLRRDTLERLAWHRQQGHELVLVSASLAAYLDPLAIDLGIDHVIAVIVTVDENGFLTGEMDGGNVRGPAKAERFLAWLAGAQAELWAYGDSAGDRELLALADHPVWV